MLVCVHIFVAEPKITIISFFQEAVGLKRKVAIFWLFTYVYSYCLEPSNSDDNFLEKKGGVAYEEVMELFFLL